MNLLSCLATIGEHPLPDFLPDKCVAFLRKAIAVGEINQAKQNLMDQGHIPMSVDPGKYFRIATRSRHIETFNEGFDPSLCHPKVLSTFIAVDCFIRMKEEGLDRVSIPAKFDVKEWLDDGVIGSFGQKLKTAYENGVFEMSAAPTGDGKSLYQIVRGALETAIKGERAYLGEPADRLPTARSYMYTLQKGHAQDFSIGEEGGMLYIEVKEKEASDNSALESAMRNIGPWGHLCIPMDKLGYSLQYFRAWAKGFCPKGSDFIIKAQHSLKRVLVLRIENKEPNQEWDDGPVGPEWDDGEPDNQEKEDMI